MCSLVFDCLCADGFGGGKGHLVFAEAVFVCLHWQMDGVCVEAYVCGQRAQLEAHCCQCHRY